jgi:hypothetical protein
MLLHLFAIDSFMEEPTSLPYVVRLRLHISQSGLRWRIFVVSLDAFQAESSSEIYLPFDNLALLASAMFELGSIFTAMSGFEED